MTDDLERYGALYGGWLTKFQHVERLGATEVEGLLDGEVHFQNKIDGSNATVAYGPLENPLELGLIVASRNQAVSVNGIPATGFNGLVEYVLAHPGILPLVRDHKVVLRGEWLVKHSLNYAPEAFRHFYVFDVQELEVNEQEHTVAVGRYLRPFEYIPLLEQYGVKYINSFMVINHPMLSEITPLVLGPDEFGAEQKEGVVLKNYNFRNQYGRTTWGKLISADFLEKKKMAWGAQNTDPPEMRLVSRFVTQHSVMKVIDKIRDERGQVTIKDMREIIGRAYHDLFIEELWDFVQKDKVGPFNFRDMRKLTEQKVRQMALDFFNGIPAIEIRAQQSEETPTT